MSTVVSLVEVTVPVLSDPSEQVTLDEEERASLRAAEAERAAALARRGVLKRLWRLPGQRANWGLWDAVDATELHEALSSLPLWPWARVEVVAMARHSNDPLSGDLAGEPSDG